MATIDEAMAVAAGHQRDGDLEAAEDIYRRILDAAPDFAPAWNLLGVISAQRGNPQVAVDCLRRAIELNANEVAFHSNLGNVYQMLNRGAEAVACCRHAVALRPNHPDVHHTLGLVLQRQGNRNEAIASYRRALELKPDDANALHSLGTVLQDLGNRDEAIASYRRAVELKPDDANIHNSLGSVLQALGQREEAIACYNRALELKPVLAEAHYNLATVLQEQERRSEALGCYHRALVFKPNFAEAHNNLGNILRELGRTDEALLCYRRALEAKPEYPQALYNLGAALDQREMPNESIACYRRAVELKPDYLAALGALVFERQRLCQWDDLSGLAQRVVDLVAKDDVAKDDEKSISTPASPFVFLALPTVTNAQQQLRCARQWVKRHVEPSLAKGRSPQLRRPQQKKSKITVGYLSGDLQFHATTILIAELFEKHDRDRFTIVGYSYGSDDDSPMRRRLVTAFDRFVNLQESSFADAAERIAADDVDILVDLKGYTPNARPQIMALRPASIQVNYLGYPGTMGAEFMDYILVDDFIVPAAQQSCFAEKLVHLPGCYQVNDSQREIAPQTPLRAECGLPEKGFVFCNFNSSYKTTPEVFGAWMRLLEAVPGSVLWQLEPNHFVVDNLRREAQARGVAPERLVFAPRLLPAEHLARLRLADLALDTFPVNAHTTASDALWAGCPLLTIAGETFASRVAGSLLRALNLNELVTTNLGDYEKLALRLANDRPQLTELRARLQAKRTTSSLFDGKKFARAVEQAYATMWQYHKAGEPPRAFRVVPT